MVSRKHCAPSTQSPQVSGFTLVTYGSLPSSCGTSASLHTASIGSTPTGSSTSTLSPQAATSSPTITRRMGQTLDRARQGDGDNHLTCTEELLRVLRT